MRFAKRLTLFAGLTAVNLIIMALMSVASGVHWGYTGDEGPAYWGELSPEYLLCGEGKAQSPIDIRDAVDVDLVAIDFHYGETANNIFNNGHTIQVDVDPGSHIVYNGITYDLLQFHFHAPSEHTIDGEAAALEIHFVHKDRNSASLAVVGILLSDGDGENESYAPVFDHLPADVGDPAPLGELIDLDTLLPEAQGYYTYQGSLTTPPCSEVVRWLLLDTPLELSTEQIAAFTAIYEANARPVQPLGERDLLRASP